MITTTITGGRIDAGRDARADALAALPYAELADALAQMDLAERADTFVLLPQLSARGAFLAMDPEAQATLLEELGQENAAAVLATLPVHVIARLYEYASTDGQRFLRATLPAERRRRLEQAVSAPLDSVARIMHDRFITLPNTLTVADARAALRGRDEIDEVIFIHDEGERLAGSVRIGEMLRHRDDEPLERIAEPGDTRVHPEDDRERAAHLLQSRGLPCVAVVDAGGRQVGTVRFDEAMDVLEVEASEDIYRKAGIGDLVRKEDLIRSERLNGGGIGYPVRIRLIFLMVTLAGGLAVGGLIDTFEETLAAIVALAVFIPLIMDMGGKVGTQSTTIFARGYTTIKDFSALAVYFVLAGALLPIAT